MPPNPSGKQLAVDAEEFPDHLKVAALQAARDVRSDFDDWDDTWDETALAVLGAVGDEYEKRIADAVATEFCRIRSIAKQVRASYIERDFTQMPKNFADLMDATGSARFVRGGLDAPYSTPTI